MPKNEIINSAGSPLPPGLREMLSRYFRDSDIKKLERHGGRVLISITAPYTTNKRKNRKPVTIDNRFVRGIERVKDSPNKIQEVLGKLTVKELRSLGRLVGQPVRSNASASEIRLELIRYFRAEDIWQRISGSERSGR